MVPIKNGPNIKLRSLIILVHNPPFTVQNLKGTDNILIIATRKHAKAATGVYFLKTFLGIKKAVNHGMITSPILIIAANIKVLLILFSFRLLIPKKNILRCLKKPTPQKVTQIEVIFIKRRM